MQIKLFVDLAGEVIQEIMDDRVTKLSGINEMRVHDNKLWLTSDDGWLVYFDIMHD